MFGRYSPFVDVVEVVATLLVLVLLSAETEPLETLGVLLADPAEHVPPDPSHPSTADLQTGSEA